ncbi:MAG: ABC transporter substrate-binding protein [Arcobacteraceae bacterium]
MIRNLNHRFLKVIVACLMACNIAYAVQEDKLYDVMKEKIDKATTVLQNKTLDIKAKEKEIFVLFDSMFDYNLMSQLSLGNQWKLLSQEQKVEFATNFEKRLKTAYIDKLYLYTNETIIVKELNKLNDNRIQIPMHIIGGKETYEVIYKLYKNPENNWLIYDVDILGISIIQTYRNQFVGVLQKDSFASLIEKLNKVEAVTK